jgi:L-lactate dehydrogenase
MLFLYTHIMLRVKVCIPRTRLNSNNKLVVRCSKNDLHLPSVGVIGCGSVGTSVASSLVQHRTARNILLYDLNTELCKGTVYDLQDQAFSTGSRVKYVKTPRELNSCDITIITAGAKQNIGESRLSLIERNVSILKCILNQMLPFKNPNAVLMIVSNPVDVLTLYAQNYCLERDDSMSRCRIIGTGTYLDTQRVRISLSEILNVSASSIHAYVIGEHGDSQVFPTSLAHVAGRNLNEFAACSEDTLSKTYLSSKNKAYEIIKWKGATCLGIGECVAHICDNIFMDKREVLPISVYHPLYEVCLGWPVVVGKDGAKYLIPINLTQEEHEKLDRSVLAIKSAYMSTL